MLREITSLLQLYKKNHFPVLLSKNETEKYIYMNYCGQPLTDSNIPNDWKEQITEIVNILKKCNISNNDMWLNNFLVNNNILYLVDFGWATETDDFPYVNITESNITQYDNLLDLLGKTLVKEFKRRQMYRSCNED